MAAPIRELIISFRKMREGKEIVSFHVHGRVHEDEGMKVVWNWKNRFVRHGFVKQMEVLTILSVKVDDEVSRPMIILSTPVVLKRVLQNLNIDRYNGEWKCIRLVSESDSDAFNEFQVSKCTDSFLCNLVLLTNS